MYIENIIMCWSLGTPDDYIDVYVEVMVEAPNLTESGHIYTPAVADVVVNSYDAEERTFPVLAKVIFDRFQTDEFKADNPTAHVAEVTVFDDDRTEFGRYVNPETL